MSIKLMTEVWDRAPFEKTTLLVLLCLADHANDDGTCYPSIPRLAKRARCSERWARDVLGELEQRGWIVRELRPGKSTVYRITPQDVTPEVGFTPEDTSPLNSVSPTPELDIPPTPEVGFHNPGTVVPMNRKEPSVEPSKKQGGRAPHPIPADFEPSSDARQWAWDKHPSIDVSRETAKFKLHMEAKGSKYVDWNKAWQNWIIRASEYEQGNAKVQPGGTWWH